MKKEILSKYINPYFFAGFTLVLLYCIPFFILGEDAYVKLHDNLDSEVVWRVILSKTGVMFSSSATIPEIMNGIPRHCLPGGYNVGMILYVFFPPFIAYAVNETIIRLVAFIGMYLLLARHFNGTDGKFLATFASSVCFAILPIYSVYGLTIAGQPLLLYAFLNISAYRYKIHDFIIITLFPYYSLLVLSGVFIIAAMLIMFAWKSIRERKLNTVFLAAIILLGFNYMIAEHNLIFNMFFNTTYSSHRLALILTESGVNTAQAFETTFITLWKGKYHAASIHRLILILTIVFMIFTLLYKRYEQKNNRDIAILVRLFIFCVLISFFSGFYNWSFISPLINRFQILKTFQFDRFYFLMPVMWYMIFFLIMKNLAEARYSRIIIVILFLFQTGIITSYNEEIRGNVSLLACRLTGIANTSPAIRGTKPNNVCSFKNWYCPEQYEKIAEFIGSPRYEYRVVSVGIDPMAAVYNGFYALDSYQNNYPLQYKEQFRRIIAAELDKNLKNKKYFDEWGNRCYIVPAWNGDPVYNLDLNTDELSKMGGKYILSDKKIFNRNNNLTLMHIFEGGPNMKQIYLYENKL